MADKSKLDKNEEIEQESPEAAETAAARNPAADLFVNQDHEYAQARGEKQEKILLLLNPKAGRGESVEILGEYISAFAHDGSPVTIYFTQSEGDLIEYVKKEGQHYDRIVASGGDGTLNELVTGYLEGGLRNELGYLPTGTTCDFANTLGISMLMDEAAATARYGTSSELDVGKINDELYFVYVASFGAFTEASYDTPTELKNTIGKLAYVANALKNLNSIGPIEVRVSTDEAIYEGKFLLGAVTNSTQIGGIIKFDRDQVALDDGRFELLLVRFPENAGDVSNILNGLRSQDYSSDAFIFAKVREINFAFNEAIPFTVDGEFGGDYQKCRIKVEEKAWRLTH